MCHGYYISNSSVSVVRVYVLLMLVMMMVQPPFDGEDEDDLMTSITDYGVAFPRFMSKESVAICSAVSSRRAIDRRPLSSKTCFNY